MRIDRHAARRHLQPYRALAVVGDAHAARDRGLVGIEDDRFGGGLALLAVDRVGELAAGAHRARRQQQPGLLLGGRLVDLGDQPIANRTHDFGEPLTAAGLGRQRQDGGLLRSGEP